MANFENNTDTWDFRTKATSSKSEEPVELKNHHTKLWIGTVKTLNKHCVLENAAIFRDKAITYVDILGTVVDRLSYGKNHIYVGNN